MFLRTVEEDATLTLVLERLFARHLEDDEPLYLVVHTHWLFGVRALFLPLLALLLTWIFLIFMPLPMVALGVLVADLFIAIWLLRSFFDYFLDAWLITDRSVIDVAWRGLFHRSSTRIDYSSIEGVSCEIKGVFGTLFRFGTVTLEKVGTGVTVSMENVPCLHSVESAILHHQEECLRTKNLKDSKAVQELLSQIVAERTHLKGT